MRLNAILTLLSGILTGIGFLIPGLSWFVFFSITPFLFVLTQEPLTLRRRVFLGFLFGAGFYGCAFYPVFFHTLPLAWIGTPLPPSLQYALVSFAWSIWVFCGASATSLFSILAPSIARTNLQRLFVLPSLWVFGELLCWFLISIAMIGPGGSIGIHVELGALGYLVADNSLVLQLASVGGVFILSWVAILSNVTLLHCLRHKRPFIACAAFVSVLVGLWFAGTLFDGRTHKDESGLNISVISTQAPTSNPNTPERGRALDALFRAATSSDVIIFPEGTAWLKDTSSEEGFDGIVIDSNTRSGDTSSYRIMEYANLATGRTLETSKQVFTPVGEYLPHVFYYAATLLGHKESADKVRSARHYSPGVTIPYPISIRDTFISALFCNEILSPTLYQQQTRAGAEILVNTASQVWYHSSRPFYAHMLRAAKVRAVENHRPLVQATDTAPSFVLDSFGRVTAETTWGEENALKASIDPSKKITPYTRAGLFVLLIPFFLILTPFLPRRKVIDPPVV